MASWYSAKSVPPIIIYAIAQEQRLGPALILVISKSKPICSAWRFSWYVPSAAASFCGSVCMNSLSTDQSDNSDLSCWNLLQHWRTLSPQEQPRDIYYTGGRSRPEQWRCIFSSIISFSDRLIASLQRVRWEHSYDSHICVSEAAGSIKTQSD